MTLRVKFILYFSILTFILIAGLIYYAYTESNRIFFLGLILWLAGIAMAYFFSGALLKNISVIDKAIAEVKENNLTARANVNSNDEIAKLAEAFNSMVESISRSQNELKFAQNQLKETNLYLETRIKERTAELIKLKNNLEKIVFERTKELHEKVAELEKFKQLTVGREMKMIELKKKIEELKAEKEE